MRGKKQAALTLACVLLAIAGVIFAELQTGYYRRSELGSMEQPAAATLSADSVYSVTAYPLYESELASGDGQAEARRYCGTCHSPRYITMQPALSAAAWEAEVNKMNKAYGAAIPEEQARKIIQYLQAHYAPETRQR